jgi:GxxExxY protein
MLRIAISLMANMQYNENKFGDLMSKVIRPISNELNNLSKQTIEAAIKVHKSLGPGLLESVYEACLVHELRIMGLKVESQAIVPIHYNGITVNANLRMDLLVENLLIVEIKSVEELEDLHTAQLLTYLKLMDLRLGLILNFNTIMLKDGIQRVAN